MADRLTDEERIDVPPSDAEVAGWEAYGRERPSKEWAEGALVARLCAEIRRLRQPAAPWQPTYGTGSVNCPPDPALKAWQ